MTCTFLAWENKYDTLIEFIRVNITPRRLAREYQDELRKRIEAFKKIFRKTLQPKHMPFITRMLMAVSEFLQSSGLIIFGIVVVLFLIYRWYYKTPNGRHVIDDIKLRTPIFGNLIQKSAISSFALVVMMVKDQTSCTSPFSSGTLATEYKPGRKNISCSFSRMR